jgi:hypothetical protein
MLPTHFWARPLHYVAPLLFMTALAVSSCAGPSPRERQQERLLARLDSSLIRELAFTNQQTDLIRRALQERLLDFFSSERAKVWQPVTETVHTCAKSTNNQINNMITMLNTEKAYTLFIKGALSDSLYHLLARFRQTALHAHERLLEEFEHTILPHEGFCDTTPNNDVKKMIQQDFAHLTNEEAKALLRYWQKEIAITENKLVTFCFNQVPNSFCGMDIVTSLVSQSHSVLASGETLTITAGVGSFSTRANPKITIQGHPVDLIDNAFAKYSLKAPNKKGKYYIPVVITYLNEIGNFVTENMELAYTVR